MSVTPTPATHFDPQRLRGVSVYRESERAFAVGDRHMANRESGTITAWPRTR